MTVLHGTNVRLEINGVEIQGTVESSESPIKELHEVLTIPSVKAEFTGTIELQDLDPVLQEVTFTKEHLFKLPRKARKPRKRLWHHKQFRTRERRHQAMRCNLEIRSEATNCLTDCPEPGACCKLIILNGDSPFGPFPRSENMAEAQDQVNEHPDLSPFEIYAFGRRPDGKPIWFLRCKMLTHEGSCGIYDYRPELCRCFKPCIDHPCLLTKGGDDALARYRQLITRVISEEGTEQAKGGDAE